MITNSHCARNFPRPTNVLLALLVAGVGCGRVTPTVIGYDPASTGTTGSNDTADPGNTAGSMGTSSGAPGDANGPSASASGGGVSTGGASIGGGPIGVVGTPVDCQPNGEINTVALTYGDQPVEGPSVDGNGEPLSNDALVLLWSSRELVCGPSTSSCTSCAAGWLIQVTLPPAYQQPGTYSLTDPAIVAFSSEQTPLPNDSCGFGGTDAVSGTIEVVSINAYVAHVRLTNDAAPEADGDYVIPRCPVVANKTMQGIALRGDQVVSPTLTRDPKELYLITGSPAIACGTSSSGTPTQDTWQLKIGLDPAYQRPGVYATATNGVPSEFTVTSSTFSPAGCAGAHRVVPVDAVQILSVEPTGVMATFWGVDDACPELQQGAIWFPTCP